MRYVYPIMIERILISPGHNYFGRGRQGEPGAHPTLDVERATVEAGRGLVGDRFFDVANAHVTFVAAEVVDVLRDVLAAPTFDAALLRRNVIVRGAALGALIGRAFYIEQEIANRATLNFRGVAHCYPCRWMDVALPGALPVLKGRGGLRAVAESSGVLCIGRATLHTDVAFDPGRAAEPLARPALP